MSPIEKLKRRLSELFETNQNKQSNKENKIFRYPKRRLPSLRVDSDSTIPVRIDNCTILELTNEFDNFDCDIISIWAMPPFPGTKARLNQILDYIKKNRKDQNTLTFFDNMYEGHVLGCIRGIHEIINHLNLDHTKVYFFTGGLEAQRSYDEYCQNKNITQKINIRVINIWEKSIYYNKDKTEKYIYEIKQKEKIFLCFNRNARNHRVAILGMLYSKNLVDKSYYSFISQCYHKTLNEVLEWLPSLISPSLFSEIKENITLNLDKFPLVLNISGYNENANYIKETDDIYYKNSYFSLVNETYFFKAHNDYFDEESVFFSEKIFKPIMCKHPFIQLNRPHALEYLRKIGYKTFHPYINESYDTVENDEERLVAIVTEVERLSKQTTEQWIEWQKNVAPIVEHNYNVIVNRSDKDYYFIKMDN